MKTIDRNQRLAELFASASELQDAAQESFLITECGDDLDLLAEVRQLMGADREVESQAFLQKSALHVAAKSYHLAEESRVGQCFGRYELLSLLGEGGMGEVYRARDTELNREVAIKLIKSSLKTKEVLRRFQSERQILASLKHPNIAQLLDVGPTDDGIPFLVLEYVDGASINTYADKHKLSITDRLKLFQDVCAAVQYAHQNLVIHRDLKPGNILVTDRGEAKLLDFGIAKLLDPTQSADPQTATVLRVMTPEYASPEQIRGEAITTSSDVYSLGVLLYELLTGRRPYRVQSTRPQELARAILESRVDKPSTTTGRQYEAKQPAQSDSTDTSDTAEGRSNVREGDPAKLQRRLRGDVDNIVLKAMRREPQRRYASVAQLSEDIRRHLEGQPVSARKDTFSYRSAKFVRRHKLPVAASAILLLTLAGGILATSLEARRARKQEARAERRFNDVRRLANSFMFEFHDAIKDVPGTLAARQLLVKNALEYLDSLAQESGDDKSLQSELAVAYERIGDVTFDVDQALESHRKAMVLNEALVNADPKNPIYRERLAQNYQSVGDTLKQKGDTKSELEYSRKALSIAEALAADYPADLKRRAELADAYVYVSLSLVQTGNAMEAVTLLQRSLELQQSVTQANPADKERRRDLAGVYAHLSTAVAHTGDYRKALEYTKENLKITDTLLAAEPTNTRYQRDEWVGLLRQGRYLAILGEGAAGVKSLRRALGYIQSLAKADAADMGHRRGLGITYLAIAEALAGMNREKEALDNYNSALTISQSLQAEDPQKLETSVDLAQIYAGRGALQIKRGHIASALSDLESARKLQEQLVHADVTNAILLRGLADIYARTAEAYERRATDSHVRNEATLPDWREARGWYQQSLSIWQQLRERGILNPIDVNKPSHITHEIQKCDAALG